MSDEEAGEEIVGDAEAPAPEVPTGNNWYDGHGFSSEDIGFVQNKGWDKPGQMLASYQGLEKLTGAGLDKIFTVPESYEDTEAWAALHSKMGRPDDAAGYELELPEEGLTDPKLKELYENTAFDAGLSKTQTGKLYEMFNEYGKEMNESQAAAIKLESETQLANLKKEWGQGWEAGEEMAKRAFRQFGVNEEQSEELEAILGTAGLIKLFKGIGDSLVGDSGVNPDTASKFFGVTADQVAANKVAFEAELKGDPARLAKYNDGSGAADLAKMRKFDEYLATGAKALK